MNIYIFWQLWLMLEQLIYSIDLSYLSFCMSCFCLMPLVHQAWKCYKPFFKRLRTYDLCCSSAYSSCSWWFPATAVPLTAWTTKRNFNVILMHLNRFLACLSTFNNNVNPGLGKTTNFLVFHINTIDIFREFEISFWAGCKLSLDWTDLADSTDLLACVHVLYTLTFRCMLAFLHALNNLTFICVFCCVVHLYLARKEGNE